MKSSREQRAESREQRAESRENLFVSSRGAKRRGDPISEIATPCGLAMTIHCALIVMTEIVVRAYNSQPFALRSQLKGLQVCMKKYPEYWLKMKHG